MCIYIPNDAVPDGNRLIAIFYVMRHGEKDEKCWNLTGKGKLQAETSSRLHFCDQNNPNRSMIFSGVFCSELLRARHTAEAALAAIDHPEIGIEENRAFNLAQFHDKEDFIKSLQTARKRLRSLSRDEAAPKPTMADWVSHLDENLLPLRECLRNGMLEIAKQRSSCDETAIPTFLVGYHGPFAGWAADNPENIGTIGYADVVLYVLSQDRGGSVYFHGSLWKCPPVE